MTQLSPCLGFHSNLTGCVVFTGSVFVYAQQESSGPSDALTPEVKLPEVAPLSTSGLVREGRVDATRFARHLQVTSTLRTQTKFTSDASRAVFRTKCDVNGHDQTHFPDATTRARRTTSFVVTQRRGALLATGDKLHSSRGYTVNVCPWATLRAPAHHARQGHSAPKMGLYS